ncbi:MAG: hypothetical protein ACKOVB_07055 [Terrabacter sp.]
MDEVRLTQWLDQEDRKVSGFIRRYGCSLESVMPCDGDPYPEEQQPRPGTFDARGEDGDDGGPCSCGC